MFACANRLIGLMALVGAWMISMSVASADDAKAAANIRAVTLDLNAGIRSQVLTPGHTGPVYDLAFSADGQWLISASSDKTLKLWNTATGALKRTIEREDKVRHVALSPDGKRLAAAVGATSGAELVQWDAQTWRETMAVGIPPRGPGDLAYSKPFVLRGIPIGLQSTAPTTRTHLVIAGSDGIAKLFDADANAAPLMVFQITDVNVPEDGYYAYVLSVAITGDGRFVATVGNDHRLIIWDAATGERKHVIHATHPAQVAFSPDVKSVVVGGDDLLKIWDVQSGQLTQDFGFFSLYGGIHCIAYSPDGRTLATGGKRLTQEQGVGEPDDNSIILWDVESGQKTGVLSGHTNYVNAVAFSPDGSQLASAGNDRTVRLWQLKAVRPPPTMVQGGNAAEPQQDIDQRFTDLEQHLQTLEARAAELESRIARFAASPSAVADANVSRTPDLNDIQKPTTHGAARCCTMVANAELKGRMGRVVVAFPQGAKTGTVKVEVFKAGEDKALASASGQIKADLLPGMYEVAINGKRVTGVQVQSAHDTLVHVGVLRVKLGATTRVDVREVGGREALVSRNGEADIGLPIGSYEAVINNQAEKIRIEADRISEF